MKKLILSIITVVFFSVCFISCASSGRMSSRQTTTTYYQGDAPAEQKEWKRCAVCDGKGSCKSCKGTGRISGDNCRSCKGSGKCTTCKGNGGYYLD